jgi:hypothetical protein
MNMFGVPKYTVNTTRAPHCLSSLCFRARDFWLMKTPLIHDMYIEAVADII